MGDGKRPRKPFTVQTRESPNGGVDAGVFCPEVLCEVVGRSGVSIGDQLWLKLISEPLDLLAVHNVTVIGTVQIPEKGRLIDLILKGCLFIGTVVSVIPGAEVRYKVLVRPRN